jgi:hypothetical protein
MPGMNNPNWDAQIILAVVAVVAILVGCYELWRLRREFRNR